jgi:hypothetical protein
VSIDIANPSSKKMPKNTPFEGVFFIHGLFFPHEIEPTINNPMAFTQSGYNTSYYENPGPNASNVEQKWSRNPNK